MFISFTDFDEFRPIEITNTWLCVRRQILMNRDTFQILMDSHMINKHTLFGNKNFLSAVLLSVLKEKMKILNPINGVFNATVHFYTIFVQIIWYPTTKVEQHHMSWVALMACKLMSEVW